MFVSPIRVNLTSLRDDPGPLTTGMFKITLDLNSRDAEGWWSEDCSSEIQHDWKLASLEASSSLDVFMSQFSFYASLLFVALTFYALVASFVGFTDSVVDMTVQSVYTLLYTSFLVYYAQLEEGKRPPMAYVSGVVSYTIAYAAFAVLALSQVCLSTEESRRESKSLFSTGSVLFFLGSLLLIWALREAKLSTALNDGSFFFLAGSITFLAGSVFFAIWAFFGGADRVWGTIGYAFFLVGRTLFATGSFVVL